VHFGAVKSNLEPGDQTLHGPILFFLDFLQCMSPLLAHSVNLDSCHQWSLSAQSGHWSALALNGSVANIPNRTSAVVRAAAGNGEKKGCHTIGLWI